MAGPDGPEDFAKLRLEHWSSIGEEEIDFQPFEELIRRRARSYPWQMLLDVEESICRLSGESFKPIKFITRRSQ